MKLGIIGAMTVEVEALKQAMEEKRIATHAGMEFCEGVLEGLPAVVVQCGVGKVNAAMCAQILCACYGVSHIVNTGVAVSTYTTPHPVNTFVTASEIVLPSWEKAEQCYFIEVA